MLLKKICMLFQIKIFDDLRHHFRRLHPLFCAVTEDCAQVDEDHEGTGHSES